MKLSLLLLAIGSLMAAASSVLPTRDSQLSSPLEIALKMAGNHEVQLSITNVSPEAVRVLVAKSLLNDMETEKISVVQ